MANFNFAPTAPGKVLFADVQAGAVLIPTKFVIGTGSLPSGKEPGDMTGVVNQLKELQVTKRTKTPDGFCLFGCVFTNEDITEDFYMRELALYARAEYRDESGTVTKSVAEVCMIYGNAGDTADLYPAYSTDAVVERKLEIASYVGADTQVELTLQSGIYIGQDEKGNPGGVAALDADGNIDMDGKKVTNLATPTDNGDAVPKDYADQMLPKSGGMMTGPINMNAQQITGLYSAPTEADHAVSKGYADRHYGAPCNILVNSDFTHPVNRQGQTVYADGGETIDRWQAESGLVVYVEDGGLNLRSEYESLVKLYQDIECGALVAGKTYTAVAWLANGGVTAQHLTPRAGTTVASNAAAYGLEFAVLMYEKYDRIILYVEPGAIAKVKYLAVYEGVYTLENLPEYRPIGYVKEAALCMHSPHGLIMVKGRDYGTEFPTTGLVEGRFFLKLDE